MKKYNCEYRGKERLNIGDKWQMKIEAANPREAYEKFIEKVCIVVFDPISSYYLRNTLTPPTNRKVIGKKIPSRYRIFDIFVFETFFHGGFRPNPSLTRL